MLKLHFNYLLNAHNLHVLGQLPKRRTDDSCEKIGDPDELETRTVHIVSVSAKLQSTCVAVQQSAKLTLISVRSALLRYLFCEKIICTCACVTCRRESISCLLIISRPVTLCFKQNRSATWILPVPFMSLCLSISYARLL